MIVPRHRRRRPKYRQQCAGMCRLSTGAAEAGRFNRPNIYRNVKGA